MASPLRKCVSRKRVEIPGENAGAILSGILWWPRRRRNSWTEFGHLSFDGKSQQTRKGNRRSSETGTGAVAGAATPAQSGSGGSPQQQQQLRQDSCSAEGAFDTGSLAVLDSEAAPPGGGLDTCRRRSDASIGGEGGFAGAGIDKLLKTYAGNTPVIVFVHQYSLIGGNSSLLFGMAGELSASGYPCITFDLRGVNKSGGRRTVTCHQEVGDVVAVCKWCVHTLMASNIFLVGSSAGAPIAGSALDSLPEIRGIVAIGYLFGFFASVIFGGHYAAIINSTKPKLFIHGDIDSFTGNSTFLHYFKKMQEPKEKQILPNVGHFAMEGPQYDVPISTWIAAFVSKYCPLEISALPLTAATQGSQ